MERYYLENIFSDYATFRDNVLDVYEHNNYDTTAMMMGLSYANVTEVLTFIACCVYGYFFEDMIAYEGVDATAVETRFLMRFCYDISVKLPYWYKKYNMIKKLLTTEDISLLQSSKMISSSSDDTRSAGGTMQKVATTPTGVSATGSTDGYDIDIGDSQDDDLTIETDGFVDKYTNSQQKYSTANKAHGEREGSVSREGSINDLLNILEKLPSSFADEVTMYLGKHFIFDYEGEENDLY